jgi:hypothetical protein
MFSISLSLNSAVYVFPFSLLFNFVFCSSCSLHGIRAALILGCPLSAVKCIAVCSNRIAVRALGWRCCLICSRGAVKKTPDCRRRLVQKQSCCLLPRKPPIAEGETGSGRVGEKRDLPRW